MSPPESAPATATLAERYRVLLHIGHTVTGTLDRGELFRAVHRETSEVLDYTGFFVVLRDPGRSRATLAFHGREGEERDLDIDFHPHGSSALVTGRAAIARGDEARRSLPLDADGFPGPEAPIHSSVSAPLLHAERVVGTLTAVSDRSDAYSDDDVELLQGIADITTVALENARFVAELDRRRREAVQIEEIGRALSSSLDGQEVLRKVVEAVVQVMGVDGSTVWMLEGSVARVAQSAGEIALPAGAEWDIGRAIRTALVDRRESVVIEDLEADGTVPDDLRRHLRSGSGLAAPILVGGDVVGALSAGSRRPRAFVADDVHVLERLASQASVALENARLHETLHALSLTDPLTGLPNRRHLQIHLQREVAAARRGRELVVVMFDLDNFKGFNDSAGHLAGDDALRAFARILERENRAMNLVARYGGDEFIAVLSDTGTEGAGGYTARIRKEVAADPILGPNGITVSTGIAAYRADTMERVEDVIEAADAGLYLEKDDRPVARR